MVYAVGAVMPAQPADPGRGQDSGSSAPERAAVAPGFLRDAHSASACEWPRKRGHFSIVTKFAQQQVTVSTSRA